MEATITMVRFATDYEHNLGPSLGLKFLDIQSIVH